MERSHSFSSYMLTSSGGWVALVSMQGMVWGLLQFPDHGLYQQEWLRRVAMWASLGCMLSVLTFWILSVQEVRVIATAISHKLLQEATPSLSRLSLLSRDDLHLGWFFHEGLWSLYLQSEEEHKLLTFVTCWYILQPGSRIWSKKNQLWSSQIRPWFFWSFAGPWISSRIFFARKAAWSFDWNLSEVVPWNGLLFVHSKTINCFYH